MGIMKEEYQEPISHISVLTRPISPPKANRQKFYPPKSNKISTYPTTFQLLYLFLVSIILGLNCLGIKALSHDVIQHSDKPSKSFNDPCRERSLRNNRPRSRLSVSDDLLAKNQSTTQENKRTQVYDVNGLSADELMKEISTPSKVSLETSPESSRAKHHRRLKRGSLNKYELVTQFDGTTGTFGMMFDIESKTVPIVIESFDIHTSDLQISDNAYGTPCDILVYTRDGSHLNFESKPDRWALLIDSQILCRSFGQRTVIPPDLFAWSDGSKIRLSPHSSRAFYVTIKEKPAIRYSKGTQLGSIHAQDNFIIVTEGSGIGGLFDSDKIYQPRLFNGVVNYSIDSTKTDGQIDYQPSNMGLVSPNFEDALVNFNLQENGCPTTTTTGFKDNMGSYGNMFDIVARKNDIYLYGMDLYTDRTTEVFYEIYTKRGRFFENDGLKTVFAWTKLGSGSFIGAGEGKGSKVPKFSPIDIPHGVEQGFYITLTTADMRYRNETIDSGKTLRVGETFINDEHFEIQAGVGVGNYPLNVNTEFFSTRFFLGKFHYLIAEECQSEAPSLVPTPLPQTQFPTSECKDFFQLVSILDGPDLSNGIMFDLRALDDLTVNTIEVKAELDDDAEDPEIFIYSKYGTYDVNVWEPSAWTKICETSFSTTSLGPNGGMLISVDDFPPIRMNKYEVRALYIFSPTISISYSIGSSLGATVVQDDHLLLMEGSSVFGDLPFDTNNRFEPRIFNGAIHYHRDAKCATPKPTLQPSTSMPSQYPSLNPTDDPFITTTVVFNFNVQHSVSLVPNKLFTEISSSVRNTIRGYLQNVDLFVLWEQKYNLQLKSVDSTFEQQDSNVPCKPVPIDAIHICTNVETSIIMTHSKNHDSGMLTYHLLERSPEITENLSDDSFGIQYSGDKSLDTTQVITLNGVPPAKMGESETKHFQQVSMRYLNSTLAQKNNVDILLVKISNQKILTPSDTLNDNNRRLVASSSLEITTVVTGKHRPPPEIDFSALVTEAVNEDSIELVQELKKPQVIIEKDEEIEISYFKHVESVVSRTHITISPSLSPTISSLSPTTETIIHPQANGSSTGATIKAVMLSFGIVGCVLSILFASYWIRNSKKKKNVMASYDYEKDRLSARDTSFYKKASSAKIYRINEEYVDENCESVLNGTMRGMEKAIKDDRRYQDYNNSHSTCATEVVSENEDETRGSLPRSRSSNIHDERHHRANQHNLRSSTSNLRSSRSLKHPSSSLRRSSTSSRHSSTSSSRSITSSRRSSTDSRRRSSTSSRYEFDFENEGRSRRDVPDP